MTFCDRAAVSEVLRGKAVAIVGSGPGVLKNVPGFIDDHEVVVRVNNYKLFAQTGHRTDVFYSYFGNAVRKQAIDLQRDGTRLCMCKCPDAQFIESAWHRESDKMAGVDFRWIYIKRAAWWFCPTYVPTVDAFVAHFDLLGGHVPTTGFAALLDVLAFDPASVYLTGFDFFMTGVHNVNERWKQGNPSDPIGHDPAAEREWLRANLKHYPITLDANAQSALDGTLKRAPLPKPTLDELMHARKVRRKLIRRNRLAIA